MKRLVFCCLMMLSGALGFAKDLGTFGQTFDIQERSLFNGNSREVAGFRSCWYP